MSFSDQEYEKYLKEQRLETIEREQQEEREWEQQQKDLETMYNDWVDEQDFTDDFNEWKKNNKDEAEEWDNDKEMLQYWIGSERDHDWWYENVMCDVDFSDEWYYQQQYRAAREISSY